MTVSVRLVGMVTVVLGCGSDGGPRTQDGGPTDGSGSTDAPPGAKRIFITGQTFQGSLGGLPGSDAACNSAAQAAQRGGTWKAWLSTTTVNAIDRIANVGPWFDMRGTLIFANKSNLTTSPAASLWYSETNTFLASDKIWTGTGFGGTYIAALSGTSPCGEWTSGAMSDQAKVGQVGRSDGAAWTAQSNTTCDQQAHLICVEQ